MYLLSYLSKIIYHSLMLLKPSYVSVVFHGTVRTIHQISTLSGWMKHDSMIVIKNSSLNCLFPWHLLSLI